MEARLKIYIFVYCVKTFLGPWKVLIHKASVGLTPHVRTAFLDTSMCLCMKKHV